MREQKECVECGAGAVPGQIIRLCAKCERLFDVERLWRLNDKGAVKAVDFNTSASLRKMLRLGGHLPDMVLKNGKYFTFRGIPGFVVTSDHPAQHVRFSYGIRHDEKDRSSPIAMEKFVLANRWGVFYALWPIEELEINKSRIVLQQGEAEELLVLGQKVVAQLDNNA